MVYRCLPWVMLFRVFCCKGVMLFSFARAFHLGALLGPPWAHLGASWGHLGAILGPYWGHLGSLQCQDRPRWHQDHRRETQDSPRYPQDSPRMNQDGPSIAQDGPRRAPTRSQRNLSGAFSHLFGGGLGLFGGVLGTHGTSWEALRGLDQDLQNVQKVVNFIDCSVLFGGPEAPL